MSPVIADASVLDGWVGPFGEVFSSWPAVPWLYAWLRAHIITIRLRAGENGKAKVRAALGLLPPFGCVPRLILYHLSIGALSALMKRGLGDLTRKQLCLLRLFKLRDL